MKQTFRFIAKCILAALPLIILVAYTALCPFGYMDEEYPSWKYSKDVACGKLSYEDYDSATVILGDSRAMAALLPEMMSDNVFNLGMGGATSVEAYYTLKNYIDTNGVPDKVIIMFAPFHYSYMDNYKGRTMYFNYLKLSEAFTVYNTGKAYEANVFDTFNVSDMFSMYLKMPDSYLPALINSRLIGRMNINKELYSNIIDAKGYCPYGTKDGCDELNYEANYIEMNREGEHRVLTLYFEALLNMCKQNNINTIVLQPPMNRASYEHLDNNYVKEYESYLNSFVLKYPEITIETEIPCYENEYFGDASHLNRRGAEKYTEEIVTKYRERL